ncbi:hypothetical protein ACFLXD_00285 [Chloroflexota bacterium]
MKIYNNYILTVAILLLLTTVLLTTMGENSLDVYFTVYIIEALVITEFFVYFNSKARLGLNFIAGILFAGFAVVVGFQVIRILT